MGLIDSGLGLLVNSLGIGNKKRDKRQLEQQRKLTAQQVQANKELADYEQKLGLDMWEKTNHSADVEQLEKAGLNVGLKYGMSGGGGATTDGGSTGSASGGHASDSASTQQADTAMGMQLAQLALMRAQKENIEADTQNKQAGAGKAMAETDLTNWENAVRKEMGTGDEARVRSMEQDAREIDTERKNAEWEAFKAGAFDGKPYDDKNNPMVKAIKAGFDKTVTELQNAKTTGDIAKATRTIEEFKANLAKEGIAPDSPWYVKILGDLLAKIGMNPISTVKKAM